jgi:tetratricopeptide (TPR) repeat protein
MTDSAPSNEELLADLLDAWEEREVAGEEVSAADLCANRLDLLPVLADRIARLRRVAALLDEGAPGPVVEIDASPPAEPLAGRYQLEKLIGEGGFGRVWRAFDLQLERPVAVKVPRPDRFLGSPGGEDAFLAEARRAARLAHPGIVSVFDVGREGAATFIVSELVDGEDLGRRIRAAPLSVLDAVRVVEGVARHLHHAHREGLTHRDVKPANILLGRDGRVFVTDFGIAASADIPGRPVGGTGTFSYMAPERWAGDPGLDPRADVYSLGAVLYELLTARPPLSGDMSRRSPGAPAAPVIPIRMMNPAVPAAVERICLQCLATEPADRPQSAEVLADQLARWLAKATNRLDLGAIGRAWRWLRRGRGLETGREATHAPTTDGSWVGRKIVLEYLPAHLSLPSGDSKCALIWFLDFLPLVVLSESGPWLEVSGGHVTVRIRRSSAVLCEDAIEHFTRQIRHRPHDASLYVRRAVAMERADRLDAALADFERAVQLDPGSVRARTGLGWTLQNLDDGRRALSELTAAIQLDRTAAWAWIARAMAHHYSLEEREALPDLDEAIGLDPTCAELYLTRGRVHFLANRPEEAIKDFHEAIRIDPKHTQGWIDRGWWYLQSQLLTEAIADFTEAIRLRLDDHVAYGLRGDAHAQKCRWAEAVNDYLGALQRHSNDIGTILRLIDTRLNVTGSEDLPDMKDPEWVTFATEMEAARKEWLREGRREPAWYTLWLAVVRSFSGQFGLVVSLLREAYTAPHFPARYVSRAHELILRCAEEDAGRQRVRS